MRLRNIYTIIGSVLVLLLWVLTDPDGGLLQHLTFGSSAIATIVILSKSILYVAVLHVTRKALFDYIDLGDLYDKAKETPQGAGLAIVGVGLFIVACAIVIYAATH